MSTSISSMSTSISSMSTLTYAQIALQGYNPKTSFQKPKKVVVPKRNIPVPPPDFYEEPSEDPNEIFFDKICDEELELEMEICGMLYEIGHASREERESWKRDGLRTKKDIIQFKKPGLWERYHFIQENYMKKRK